MKSISVQYQELKENKISKHQFLRNARMLFPNYVTQHNSFEDSVKILKNKGLLNEGDAVKGVPDKAPSYDYPTQPGKYMKVVQEPEVDEQDGIYPATSVTDIPKEEVSKPIKSKNRPDGLEPIKDKDKKNEMKKIRLVRESKKKLIENRSNVNPFAPTVDSQFVDIEDHPENIEVKTKDGVKKIKRYKQHGDTSYDIEFTDGTMLKATTKLPYWNIIANIKYPGLYKDVPLDSDYMSKEPNDYLKELNNDLEKNIKWNWNNADVDYDYSEEGDEMMGGTVFGKDSKGNMYKASFSGGADDDVEDSYIYDVKMVEDAEGNEINELGPAAQQMAGNPEEEKASRMALIKRKRDNDEDAEIEAMIAKAEEEESGKYTKFDDFEGGISESDKKEVVKKAVEKLSKEELDALWKAWEKRGEKTFAGILPVGSEIDMKREKLREVIKNLVNEALDEYERGDESDKAPSVSSAILIVVDDMINRIESNDLDLNFKSKDIEDILDNLQDTIGHRYRDEQYQDIVDGAIEKLQSKGFKVI